MGSCQRWAAFGQAVQQLGAQHPSAGVGTARSRSVSTTTLWLPRSSKSHSLCLAPTQGQQKGSLGCTLSRWCSPHQEGERICFCRKWGIFVMMEVEKCRGSGLYICCPHSPLAIASELSPKLLLHLAWSLCLVAAFAFSPGLFVMSGSFLFFKSLLDEDAVSTAAARLWQHTGTSAGHTEQRVRSSASQCHLGKSWTIHFPLLFPYGSKPLVNSRHTGECRGKNYVLCEFKDINHILSAGSYDVWVHNLHIWSSLFALCFSDCTCFVSP